MNDDLAETVYPRICIANLPSGDIADAGLIIYFTEELARIYDRVTARMREVTEEMREAGLFRIEQQALIRSGLRLPRIEFGVLAPGSQKAIHRAQGQWSVAAPERVSPLLETELATSRWTVTLGPRGFVFQSTYHEANICVTSPLLTPREVLVDMGTATHAFAR